MPSKVSRVAALAAAREVLAGMTPKPVETPAQVVDKRWVAEVTIPMAEHYAKGLPYLSRQRWMMLEGIVTLRSWHGMNGGLRHG